jgi:outer membrane autotransporter protein
VAYGSNNPQVAAVDSTFLSSTGAKSVLVTVGGGYTFYLRSFSADPYLNWQYQGTHIGGFSESGFGTDPELATSVGGQSVSSLVGIAGLKLQYAFSPPFGVILPYVYGEFRHEFRDQSQVIASSYTSAAGGSFALPTDSIDPNYYEAGAGLMADLAHHFHLYAQYTKVLHLEYYTDSAVSGGFRYEF